MIEKSSVIAMSDDAGPFFITHTKSHNMKALVIPSHSWSPLLPLSCFYEQKWTFLGLCKAIWSIFGGGVSTWQGLSEHTGDSDNSHSFQNHSDNTNGINIDFLEGTVTVKANDRKWVLTDTHFHTIHWWFCQGHAWLCNTARHSPSYKNTTFIWILIICIIQIIWAQLKRLKYIENERKFMTELFSFLRKHNHVRLHDTITPHFGD